MRIKHADSTFLVPDASARRKKERKAIEEKVESCNKSTSPLSQLTDGYPKLSMNPVVELERLLKIYCIRCARTSFFVNDTCYPRCRHLELLEKIVRKPSPSCIYKLSSKTIQRSQMQGELYFFYQTWLVTIKLSQLQSFSFSFFISSTPIRPSWQLLATQSIWIHSYTGQLVSLFQYVNWYD